MPFRCVHNCPRNFETSRKVSLTHHQAQCPAYSAQRIAAERLRATWSNDTKQWIAAHRKFKSMVCHGCHYQCYCQSECMIQLFLGSQVGWYGRIVRRCPHVNGCSISWHWSASHDRAIISNEPDAAASVNTISCASRSTKSVTAWNSNITPFASSDPSRSPCP